jgi:hypothetical protein
MTYKIWTSNGRVHPEFTGYEAAADYVRDSILDSQEIHTTEWYETEQGQAVACYGSLGKLKADQDGAYAPKIERL